ncbi:MAG: DUF3775 domain-containing protein, partial [Burkholderiales bacterium]
EFPDTASNPADDGGREILLDYPDDATDQELTASLERLNESELTELLALVTVGRGDFTKEEWPEAILQARDFMDEATLRYLLDLPLLADYLEEGLSQMGFSCEEAWEQRL